MRKKPLSSCDVLVNGAQHGATRGNTGSDTTATRRNPIERDRIWSFPPPFWLRLMFSTLLRSIGRERFTVRRCDRKPSVNSFSFSVFLLFSSSPHFSLSFGWRSIVIQLAGYYPAFKLLTSNIRKHSETFDPLFQYIWFDNFFLTISFVSWLVRNERTFEMTRAEFDRPIDSIFAGRPCRDGSWARDRSHSPRARHLFLPAATRGHPPPPRHPPATLRPWRHSLSAHPEIMGMATGEAIRMMALKDHHGQSNVCQRALNRILSTCSICTLAPTNLTFDYHQASYRIDIGTWPMMMMLATAAPPATAAAGIQ